MIGPIQAGKTDKYIDYQDIKNLLEESELIAGDPETWLQPLKDFLDANKVNLTKYFNARQNEISANMDGWYVADPYNLENNEKYKILYIHYKELEKTIYTPIKNEFVKIINDNNIKIICFHATRLTHDEIIRIKHDGLQPLSKKLIINKLDILKNNKIINLEEYKQLLKHATDPYQLTMRSNQVWFLNTISEISNSGCYELFGLWGGEIFYRGGSLSYDLRAKISQIGEPCLIITPLDASQIQHFDDGNESLVFKMIFNYLGLWKYSVGCDVHIDGQVILVKDVLIAQ
jgi:hypothetical protein